MQGRTYAVVFTAVAVTAQQDLVALVAGSSRGLEVLRCWAGQSSDAGDAQDEQLDIRLKRGATGAGSGGSTFTPIPLDPTDTAASASARINDTTPASGGTIVTPYPDAFNVRAGWIWLPTPEERIILAASARFVMGLHTTPADSLTMSGGIIFRELG